MSEVRQVAKEYKSSRLHTIPGITMEVDGLLDDHAILYKDSVGFVAFGDPKECVQLTRR